MGEATSFGWAVLYPCGPTWGSPGAPAIDTVSGTREGAMHRFVASWRQVDDHSTVSKVWQKAYRRGWRLARVSITPALGYSA